MDLQSPSFQNKALCKQETRFGKVHLLGRKLLSVSDVGVALGGSRTLLPRTCDPGTGKTFYQPRPKLNVSELRIPLIAKYYTDVCLGVQ